MKNRIWIFVFFCLFSLCGYAQDSIGKYEFGLNLATVHTFAKDRRFANKIDAEGIVMNNPLYYFRYNKHIFLTGQDSMGSHTYGWAYKTVLRPNLSLLSGFYTRKLSNWKGYNNNEALLQLKDIGFIPIVGLEYRYKIKQLSTKNYNTNFNFIITPALIMFTISFDF